MDATGNLRPQTVAEQQRRLTEMVALMAANDASPTIAALSCGTIVSDRLGRIDNELAALTLDLRPTSAVAARLRVAERNGVGAACMTCGGCNLSTAPLTRPVPMR